MAEKPPGAGSGPAAADLPLDVLVDNYDRMQALARHSTDGIIEVDERGCFLFVNNQAAELLGIDPTKALGRPMQGFSVHPDDRQEAYFEKFMEGIAAGKTTTRFEARILRPDGCWRWMESHFSAHQHYDGHWHTIIIARDITDRMAAEERLRQSEERYRVLAEAAEEMIAETDTEGHLLYISPAVETVLGHPPEYFAERFSTEHVHPEDRRGVTEKFEDAALRGKHSFTGPYRHQHADGSWRWIETEAIPFRRGDEQRVLLLGRDVTERHNIDEHVQQAQRLEGLGVMAGGIAHDFNNLLTPILGDASLALSDLPEGSPARAALQRIQRAARRAATLTHQMLAYAGKGPLQPSLLDLSTLVAEMMQLIESSVARKATLHSRLATGLPAIRGDAAQLCQVVMNVISNAAEAVEGHGSQIEIRTGSLSAAPDLGNNWQGEELPEGPVVYFEVEDDGRGMDEETRAHIFDPFFTTKFTGRGLGLAATLGIVSGHGGALEIDSTPGVGTRFRVLLPATGEALPQRADAGALRAPWRGSGTALVIDDDDGVRDLVRETLSRAGFLVICAATGEAGIKAFTRDVAAISLVVLDRTMPIQGGGEVLAALRNIDADAHVLLISGYSDQGIVSMLTDNGPIAFLQKPFLPDTLLEKAQQLLES
ncbi:MAG: PAS domain S-box protein [Deltaproteobacteria bacterium]|nr:PAS domain S-box protein [Deltaproteobacteria bacterium]MBW2359738.1 PAS domain S-box protein [Deltaproteobacteria bacterium]